MSKDLTPDQTIEMLRRERDGLIESLASLRTMIDEINGDSEAIIYDAEIHGPVYAAIAYTWGPRCDVYEAGCSCCEAWAEYDRGRA